MNSENFSFENDRGHLLAARLESPVGVPRAVALFAHCFTCTKNINAVRRIGAELVRRGIAMLSFDFTGLGGSEGEFAESAFSSQVSDIVCAARHLKRARDMSVTILVGHSLGGTATLYAARELEEVKGVVTIGSPSDPDHVAHLFDADVSQLDAGQSTEVCISGRPFRIDSAFIQDLKKYPLEEWVGDIKKEVLILHSPVDEIVEIAHAEKLFRALRHPKSYISLNRADHMLTNAADAHFAAGVIAGWAEKFFDSPDKAEHGSTVSPHQDHQVVAEIGELPFVTAVRVQDGHSLVGDKPPSVGGSDTGPTPFGYLLTSLAVCTTMTLQAYSARKDYTLSRVVVYCDYHEKPKPRIDRFIEVEGTFDDAQRERLLTIANLCSIHKLLKPGIEIATAFVED